MKRILILMAALVVVGCGNRDFSSSTDRRGAKDGNFDEVPSWEQPNPPVDLNEEPEYGDDAKSIPRTEEVVKEFNLTCDGAQNPVHPVIDISEPAKKKVIAQIKGEFCPAGSQHLRVVFVIDFSASMGKHDLSTSGLHGRPGHDPMVGGTCGRYQAVRAVVDKLKSLSVAHNNIDIALVPFSTAIVTPYEVKPTDLATFESVHAKPDKICRFVLQKNSLYSDEPGATLNTFEYKSGTKFDRALKRAEEYLAAKDGNRLLYFITDGEPTNDGSGLVEAQQLAKLANLTANSLLLSHDSANARKVLEALTPGASSERVIDVADAKDLANVISGFKVPEISRKSGGALLKIVGGPQKEIGLVPLANGDFFAKVGEAFQYKVQPFVLVGKAGDTHQNLVEVRATGSDGRPYKAVVEIRYRPLP